MSERDTDVKRKRQSRKVGREVIIPPPEDPERRARLEADDEAWLRYYCGNLFWYDFTSQQSEMIAAIRDAILIGDDQSLAASRGEGKSKIAERVLLKYSLQGKIKFSVLFAATGSAAADSLQSIMGEIETNDRLLADYPEVCVPVRALEGVPNRAAYQLVSGNRHDNGEKYKRRPSKFRWCGQEIYFPTVPGSPSSGAIIATRGLDSAVRGINKRDRRPDVCVLDDPDTEDTANSEEQADKLEKRIDRAIGGLGGQQRGVARVMLTTLQNRICVSFRFTDPTQKPSWKGRRFRFLVTPPERADLWSEYVSLRRADWQQDTTTARAFYLANRESMDRGAIVANPNRFTPEQVSALQFYYDEVARKGPDYARTELDNDPPVESGPISSGITSALVQRQVSGLQRSVIPRDCTVITQGIDVGKSLLHWVVVAWKPDATSYVIDYGTTDVLGTQYGSDQGLDRAINAAILRRMDEYKSAHYANEAGEVLTETLTLVDSRYRTDAVLAAVAQVGLGIMPVMGIGTSAGAIRAKYSDVERATVDRKPGNGWFLKRSGKLWIVNANADAWKSYLHDRWMTAPDQPGCMFLFGQPSDTPDRLSFDERGHTKFAEHICAEVEIEEEHQGAIRRRWQARSTENHWGDASYYACVAADLKKIRLYAAEAGRRAAPVPQQQSRPAGRTTTRVNLTRPDGRSFFITNR